LGVEGAGYVLRSCCLLWWRSQRGGSARSCRSSISSAGAKDIIEPALIHLPLSHKADNQHESCNKGQFTSNRFIRRASATCTLRMRTIILCLLMPLHPIVGPQLKAHRSLSNHARLLDHSPWCCCLDVFGFVWPALHTCSLGRVRITSKSVCLVFAFFA
jgi:hypothetical protein